MLQADSYLLAINHKFSRLYFMNQQYDFIIVGTGAGGGTLAYALAPTGAKILLLERGTSIPRNSDNWNPRKIYQQGLYQTKEQWYNEKSSKPIKPSIYHRIGGNTKVYGGALLRMQPQDFAEVVHQDGYSPAWCIDYDHFASYYTQAEKLYKVHGQRGTDPCEAGDLDNYSFPPLPHAPQIQQVADKLMALGLSPFPLPMALDYLDPSTAESCILCKTCDGYPCKLGAKADAETCCVQPALKYPNVTLIAGAEVERLVTSADGKRVVKAIARVNGESQTFSGDCVVVSCGAVNSAVLLLRSANDQHPQGLANSSGMVGRNLMKHNTSKLYGISPKTQTTVFQKTLALNDFYYSTASNPRPLGHIHLMGKHTREMMSPDFPDWLPQPLLQWLANHSVDWWAQTEDFPDPENRVTLSKTNKIHINYTPNNQSAHQELKTKFKSILRQIGFPIVLDVPSPLKIMNHQCGTCRMGSDPKTSVLNQDCRTHDLENLYLVDASFFPSSAAVNPTLTIAANALRVADTWLA
jgi:choline dehydrogenase-like flavoprotein